MPKATTRRNWLKSKSAFQDLSAFDLVDINAFDDLDLAPEDKILLSQELRSVIQEEVNNIVSKLPIGEIISRIVKKSIPSKEKPVDWSKSIEKAKEKLSEEIKKEKEDVLNKLKDKYVDLKNQFLNLPKYQFGGFAPPNPANSTSGTFLKNSNGTWSGITWDTAGANSNPLYIGDPNTNGSWRFFDDGTNLIVQRREAAIWVEKSSFLS